MCCWRCVWIFNLCAGYEAVHVPDKTPSLSFGPSLLDLLVYFFYNLQHIIISQLTKVWVLCSKSNELNWSNMVQFLEFSEYIYSFFLQRWVEAAFLFEALPSTHGSVFESWIAAANSSNFTTESYLWLEDQCCFEIFLWINCKYRILRYKVGVGCYPGNRSPPIIFWKWTVMNYPGCVFEKY